MKMKIHSRANKNLIKSISTYIIGFVIMFGLFIETEAQTVETGTTAAQVLKIGIGRMYGISVVANVRNILEVMY